MSKLFFNEILPVLFFQTYQVNGRTATDCPGPAKCTEINNLYLQDKHNTKSTWAAMQWIACVSEGQTDCLVTCVSVVS